MHAVTSDGLVQRVLYQADADSQPSPVEYLGPDVESPGDAIVRASNGAIGSVSQACLTLSVEDR